MWTEGINELGPLDEKPADGEINDVFQEVPQQELQAKFFDNLNITLTSSTQLELLSYKEKVAATGKTYLAKVHTHN